MDIWNTISAQSSHQIHFYRNLFFSMFFLRTKKNLKKSLQPKFAVNQTRHLDYMVKKIFTRPAGPGLSNQQTPDLETLGIFWKYTLKMAP